MRYVEVSPANEQAKRFSAPAFRLRRSRIISQESGSGENVTVKVAEAADAVAKTAENLRQATVLLEIAGEAAEIPENVLQMARSTLEMGAQAIESAVNG